MNKAILKEFAIESRKDLMDRIKLKLNLFYIDEKFESKENGDMYILSNDKHVLNLTKIEKAKRDLLLKRINEIGVERVIEESAYTWFNRLIAIRYMEVHDFLPLGKNNESLGIRVLSSNDNTPKPEILKFSNLLNSQLDIEFEQNVFTNLSNENEKFKYVLQLVCNKMKKVFPIVFGGNMDYIDLLIPENLISETGFVTKMICEIPIENFQKVEIIGWLYQYYNQSEKDRVISAKKAYKKHEIAYATQLFTPDWIVKYMVENSLGLYCIEHGASEDLIKDWKYFIKKKVDKKEYIDPQKIKVIDPCCGSGHILVYIFEVLYKVYEYAGYNKKDIPELILKNNIYGLEVDDRAGQLSILSLLLKSREFDSRLFEKDIVTNLNVVSFKETESLEEFAISSLPNSLRKKVDYLIDKYSNSKEIGSLLYCEMNDFDDLEEYLEKENTLETLLIRERIKELIKENSILNIKYDVVVTNPPYLNLSLMSNSLKKYITDNFEIAKYDMFSAFIKRIIDYGKENARFGLLTPYVWMFISSYQKFRKYLLETVNISSLVQFEYNSFEAACVPVCIFTLLNTKVDKEGIFVRLADFKGTDIQEIKTLEAINNEVCDYKYIVNKSAFEKIPGNTISYWVSENFINNFIENPPIVDKVQFKQGMATSDNKRFLRLWYEVDYSNISRNSNNLTEAKNSGKKWFPYNKGGDFRRWYGNQDYVVNWYNDGEEMKEYTSSLPQGMNVRLKSREYYFKPQISWSSITTGPLSFRYYPEGFIFDTAGSCIFDTDDIGYYCGIMNSKMVDYTMKAINPTINNTLEDMKKIPIIADDRNKEISSIAESNIKLCKDDWDNYENSMDFKVHPLIKFKDGTIENSYKNWSSYCDDKFNELYNNEIKLNSLVNNIYKIEEKIEIDETLISYRKANLEKNIKSLINYAVGCMFGRYSLDKLGLIYAGGKFDFNAYSTFVPDKDNIIPISDDPNIYYEDDIVNRFVEFISLVYGEQNLETNLEFISQILGRKGTETPKDTIRKYFLNNFYSDHCNSCSVTGSGNRPIYWLFDSGKKNGFKCLIYMHRYDNQLLSKIRVKYLHKTQDIYNRKLEEINYRINNEELTPNDRKELQTSSNIIIGKINECISFEEKIGHLANQMIEIDLDDGVKDNYVKFEDVLAKIK